MNKQKCILFLSRKTQNYSTVSSSEMHQKIQSNLNQNSSVIIFGACQHFSKFYIEEYIVENRYLGQKMRKEGEVALADIEMYYKGRII